MDELKEILINMGFLVVATDIPRLRPALSFSVSEKTGTNSIEVCYYEERDWFTVHFPDYLSFETINVHRVVKYAYMKTIDDVILLMSKAPYRNESIKEAFRMEVIDIKLAQLV